MATELRVPAVGESVSEVQIAQWLKREGDWAEKDENLVELETDKASVEVPSPVSGTLTKLLKQPGDVAAVGEVIGYIEESATQGAASAPTAEPKPAAATPESAKPAPAKPEPVKAEAATAVAAPPARPAPAAPAPRPAAPAKSPQPAARGELMPSRSPAGGSREDELVPMSPIRRRIAERLVQAQQQAALLTTFNEIDMTSVMQLRKEQGETFKQAFGVKLGFMSFFVKASIDALRLVPQINAEIRDSNVVYHNYYDVGIAVGGGKGLVVPVLRNAERMSFADIERTIAEFAVRARDNQLKLEELQGGTFTISNGGIYGSLLSTPIVNPPQSGVLGLHAIQERPVARDGQVVIRPMMYVALTYDHRIVDGREAVTFLKRIKEVMEEPTRLLLEV
jgi:2-oxoglutarate dehydrogenase E2 component (dihydrolipoamide succinyltransferase)